MAHPVTSGVSRAFIVYIIYSAEQEKIDVQQEHNEQASVILIHQSHLNVHHRQKLHQHQYSAPSAVIILSSLLFFSSLSSLSLPPFMFIIYIQLLFHQS